MNVPSDAGTARAAACENGTLLDVALNVALLFAAGTWWLLQEKAGSLLSRGGLRR